MMITLAAAKVQIIFDFGKLSEIFYSKVSRFGKVWGSSDEEPHTFYLFTFLLTYISLPQ